jgi:hypothetical protein
MTTQESRESQESAVVVEMITVVIDGFEVTVPKGTLVIRAAEKLGIQIPRFCDHPLLDLVVNVLLILKSTAAHFLSHRLRALSQ